ncbi:MAG: hypothetical protein ABEJ79_07280 [Halolamina sp.]
MTDPDLLGPFAAADVAAVATERDVPADAVRGGLAEQQRLARRHRDVDGLVFEYRKEFREDPVLARDDDVYYLAVPSRVWPEFAAGLEASEDVVAAVRTVHQRAVVDRLGGDRGDGASDDGADDDREAMVLTRS